jgi:signal transduction histidine kinase
MRRGLSLRLRIMAAVALGLTAVMALLGFSGVQVLQESKRRLLDERLITARALAERLDDALLVTVQHLAGLAASPDLRELAARGDGNDRWDALAGRVPFASYGLYLLDGRGQVVYASRQLLQDRGRNLSSYEVVRQVLAGSRMAISGLLEALRTRTPIMLVCVAADPGALCAASDLSQAPFDRYISGVQLGQTGHAVIVDAQGRVLASTDVDDRFGADEHPDFHTDLITRREARVGPAAYYKQGVPVELHIMAFAPSRVASWGVSYGQTEAETLAPVAQTRARMLGFGLLALLVALAFAWWDTGAVTRPLRRLASQTRRIASGDLGGTVLVERRDELGELAESFEVMRAKLRALLEDLTHREAEAQALYEVSREVLSRPDLKGILQSIVGHARRLLDADVAVICLRGERWHGEPAAVSGPDDAVVPGAPPLPLCAGRNGPMLRIPAEGCPVVNSMYGRAHVVAALMLDGVVQGALCVGTSRADEFDARATGLLSGLANLAAIALRSAELHEQLHHLAVLEERERIGRDLHDSTLQSLYGIALTLESARASVAADPKVTATRMEQSLTAMSKVATEIRGFVHGLRAPGSAGRPLAEALALIVGEMNAGGTVPVGLEVRDGLADLPETDRAQVVLVVREALANVMRHSRASRAEVLLDADAEAIRVAVKDDGCGFDPEARQGQGEGLGNMAARAARVGGRLTITSSPEAGTTVDITLPRGDRGGGIRGDPSGASAHR